jgi:predicted DNA binding CopG/RHH family protein
MPSKFIKEFHSTARNYEAIKEKLPMARIKPVLKELKMRVKSEGKDFDTYPESIIEQQTNECQLRFGLSYKDNTF